MFAEYGRMNRYYLSLPKDVAEFAVQEAGSLTKFVLDLYDKVYGSSERYMETKATKISAF